MRHVILPTEQNGQHRLSRPRVVASQPQDNPELDERSRSSNTLTGFTVYRLATVAIRPTAAL
jgi:hypothetical protein